MAKKKEMDNLAKDAAAALAAGMSYGRWKAMQENPVVEKEEKIPEGWRTCKRCGKPFKVKNFGKGQLYCELACQKAAQRERDKDKIREHYREYMAKRRAEERKKEE